MVAIPSPFLLYRDRPTGSGQLERPVDPFDSLVDLGG